MDCSCEDDDGVLGHGVTQGHQVDILLDEGDKQVVLKKSRDCLVPVLNVRACQVHRT
jgi:hypothetical protein